MDNKSTKKICKELFDDFIDIFLESGDDKLQIEVEGIDSDCLKNQFNKRIKERNLDSKIRIVMFNNLIYLTNPQVLFKIPSHVP
jgi:hypothetical protein